MIGAILTASALLIAGLLYSLNGFGTHLASQSTESAATRPDSSSDPASEHSASRLVQSDENGLTGQVSSSQSDIPYQNIDERSQQDGNGVVRDDTGTADPDTVEHEATQPTPRRSISGSVIDGAGVPLPGMEVVATPAIPDEATGTSRFVRTVSDARGMFEFAELDSGAYILDVAESETHQSGSLRARSGSDTADIHLQRKGTIAVTGTVVDASGAPLPNASVRALGSNARATTDEQGRYQITIDSRKVSGHPVLDFSLLGFRTSRARVPNSTQSGDDTVELDIKMEPLGELVTFRGGVQDESGGAVAGAGVTLSSLSSSFNASVSTGDFGEFSIEAVEAGQRYRLVVDPRSDAHRRFSSEPLVIDQANNTYDVQLENSGQASLSGTLMDPAGAPLPYFMLWVRNIEQTDTPPVPIETDAAGKFDPLLLSAGPIQLESRSSPRLEVSGIVLSPGESLDMRVPLDWGSDWLLGRVVDDDGQPVAQARISVHWSRQFGDGRSVSSRQTRSDAAGFFGFSNLGASRYLLTCSAPGFRTRRLDAALDSGSELVIQMEPSAEGG